ncbi:MAG: type II secretion system major pseudopilin GspG [Syntrophobacteraceae bacterium]|nr:type II secretion system major pseudopilin GspG [Syntrophobacteraceae bacterium]
MTLYPNPQYRSKESVCSNKGFTLIELLVVMVILGLLVGLIGLNVFKHLGESKQKAAGVQISMLGDALDAFRLSVGRYPTTDEGLGALYKNPGIDKWDGPYLRKDVPNDPWGRPYVYRCPGEHGDYDLESLGEDGQEGGTGENADVTSWQ